MEKNTVVDKEKKYSIPAGVCKFRYDNGLKLEYADEGLFTLIKMTPDEFAKEYDNSYERLLKPQAWEILRKKIENSLSTEEVFQMEYAVSYKGRDEWRLMQAAILEKGEKPLLQCVITDITAVKETYLQLEKEQAKLNIIANMSGDMLFEYDIENDTMEYTSQRDGVLFADENIRNGYVKNIMKSGYVHPDDANILKQFCEELQIGKKHIYFELRKKYMDGRFHWVEIEGTTLYDYNGQPIKVIGRTNNIDERKNKEEQMRLGMERDSLTGLLNHQTTVNKIKARLNTVSLDQPNWLIIIDVDNFKVINDMNGHLVGDAVLCMVADELKSAFRGQLLGRIGGDEFATFVEGMSRKNLESILTELNNTVQDFYKDTERNLEVSCSVGVVQVDDKITDYDTLFQWADYALYKVKQGHKKGYHIAKVAKKIPKIGYLTREGKEEYTREEAMIQNEDELVLFTLELLNNVADVHSGLKMVSDRICSFFDIDDIAYISCENEVLEKKYHWNRKQKRQTGERTLPESTEAWEYIQEHFDSKGMLALRAAEIRKMPGEQVESIFFVRIGKEDTVHGYMVFIDRHTDRSFEKERDALCRLADIIYNNLQQLYESEREKNAVEHKINYDSLTGLLKYQRFIYLTEQYMKENKDGKFYFVYSDFANFQYINEIYGYVEGDKILKAFAERLQNEKYGIYFTRVTSDYFVGFLAGEDEDAVRDSYLKTATDFCAEINKKYDQSNLVLVSGFSRVLDNQETPAVVIDRANIARKYGKDTDNTIVITYTKEIKERNDAEKAITANMTSALANNEFKAWLQPKISLKTGKIIGAEALARWQKSDGTMIYPDKFIPVFEKNGFIKKVDFAVLDAVLAYLEEAMQNGEEVVPISVNFSRRHNETADFVDQILQKMKVRNIPANYLEAELTESIFMMDLSVLMDNIQRLKESGIAVSIDDFGSGYSSLNVLAKVEVDIIKLDRKFLDYTGSDSKAPVFVKYLVKMMKGLGYKVLVEGVETKEQLDLLRNAECDMVQGYYYAKPMPISEFKKFLKEFNN